MTTEHSCPECKSEDITAENKSEYTGGGYADYWTEYECNKCGHQWEDSKQSDWY